MSSQPAIEQTPEPSATASPEATPEPTEAPTQTVSPTPAVTPAPVPPKANEGKQGYIYIPNTKVDYRVMLADDNDYYLDRDENGKKDYHGAIYMDFRNAFGAERRNIILYGHNMKDNSMFTTLHRFEKQDFFGENKTIDFEMFGVKYKYEIVYSGMIDYTKYNHIHTAFQSEDAFLSYFKEGSEHAQFVRSDYEPQPGDQMLTLSTCVSHSINNYEKKRMIVVARMTDVVGEGEHSKAPDSFTYETAAAVFANRTEYANAMMAMANDGELTNGDYTPPGE